ncbi:LysE family translocator [Kineosporia sp. NBRC 101731]|uniref:LysE family translocator n=1 Tax=Kineosporia sp. NBRC 101731 TaxID=3032199 RepID=UPI0024A0B6FA|nr:LysE family translocator [Kineosporia sp. NBRC 101731]GLY29321.1 lysine transporter LysE [Kineosporia sp. NBRC 101731]
MDVLSAVASFAVVAGLLTIMPGLDTALVLRSAAAQGRAHAFATALGINTGALIWGAAAAGGATALLTASHTAYTGLRIAGAVYLVWMGAGMLRSLVQRSSTPAQVEGEPVPVERAVSRHRFSGSYRRGLTTNLLNPKIGVFYMAMLPQFIPAGVPHLPMGVLLAFVHDVEGMLWFTLLIFGVERVGVLLKRLRMSRRTAQRSLDGVTGTVLIGFGVELALSER